MSRETSAARDPARRTLSDRVLLAIFRRFPRARVAAMLVKQ
jgi:hypothetical protein